MSLVKQVRGDPQYLTFLKILKTTREKVNLETSLNEALNLHMARTSRSLTGNDRYSPKKLIDSTLKDLSTRSRLVEVRVTNDRNLSHLREAMDALRRYVSTEYAEELKDFATVGDRKSFIDRVLKSANELLAEGDSVLATIDHLVKDIDQSGHSMRHVVDCLKLLENKSGGKIL